MKIPRLSHLQFAILWSIGNGHRLGTEVRKKLLKHFGIKSNGPRFYRLMKRLKDAGMVTSSNEPASPGFLPLVSYQRTKAGYAAIDEAMAFYEERRIEH